MEKKIISMILSLAMLFTFAVPSFGEGSGETFAVKVESGTDVLTECDYVSEAIEYMKNNNKTGKITLLKDVKDCFEIPSDFDTTIDLNGHVLKKKNEAGSVITNYGKLTIIDSDPSLPHYFIVSDSDIWELMENTPSDIDYTFDTDNGLMKNGIKTNDTPKSGNIVKILGGCITGGNGDNPLSSKVHFGGGINNNRELIIKGGCIVGNSADIGGGIYNNNNKYFATTVKIVKGGVIGNKAVTAGGIMISDEYAQFSCFVEGTAITMADGSTKNIEEITVDDIVKTLNHETGEYENNRVNIAYKGEKEEKYFTLNFEDGTALSICGCHDLFEKSSLSYVTVSDENCQLLVGRYFYSAESNGWVKLESVTKSRDKKMYYSVYTVKAYNCIANGMLTLPDDVEYCMKVFTFNEDLSVNQEELQKDIEKYGLCKFEDIDFIKTEKSFEELNGKYLYILFGKGLISREEAAEIYKEWYNTETEEEPPLLMVQNCNVLYSPLMAIGTESEEENNSIVTLGGNAIVKYNSEGNLYLADDEDILIKVLQGFKGDVGITTEATPTDAVPVRFTTETNVNYKNNFFSDISDYFVRYIDGSMYLSVSNEPEEDEDEEEDKKSSGSNAVIIVGNTGEEKNNEAEVNPETGIEPVMGITIAMAAVSLAFALAVNRKE